MTGLLARDPLPGPSEPDKAQFFVRPAVGPKMSHPGFHRGRRDQLRVPVNLDPVGARRPGGLDNALSFLSHSEPLFVGQAQTRIRPEPQRTARGEVDGVLSRLT